jgi:hypothetical protein
MVQSRILVPRRDCAAKTGGKPSGDWLSGALIVAEDEEQYPLGPHSKEPHDTKIGAGHWPFAHHYREGDCLHDGNNSLS